MVYATAAPTAPIPATREHATLDRPALRPLEQDEHRDDADHQHREDEEEGRIAAVTGKQLRHDVDPTVAADSPD